MTVEPTVGSTRRTTRSSRSRESSSPRRSINVSTRKLLTLALALAALGVLVIAQAASATHVRPKGATPLKVPLVPAYQECTSANRTHGAPLAFPSCSPPGQSSNILTVGTPDANGAAANSVSFVRLDVRATSPEDVLIRTRITDVRCRPVFAGQPYCPRQNPVGGPDGLNAVGGPDYTGELRVAMGFARLTDH